MPQNLFCIVYPFVFTARRIACELNTQVRCVGRVFFWVGCALIVPDEEALGLHYLHYPYHIVLTREIFSNRLFLCPIYIC